MLVGLLLTAFAAWATSYVYDNNGRVVVVTNASGESARYTYDAMGNLVTITRFTAAQLAVFGFSPDRGAPGQSVTILGRGFSTTAASNVVKFNGTAATVSSAAADKLVAVVPAGATTGPISVTTGASTATSASSFVVDASAKAPTITTVTPLAVEIGQAITVAGQNLSPLAGQTATRLNGRPVNPSSLTNTQIVFTTPPNASSGPVNVTTVYGSATSTSDVVVAPPGVGVANIKQTKRLAVDGAAQAFSTTAATDRVVALVQGNAGDYLSAQFTGITASSVSYSLYGVDNTLLVSGSVSTNSPTFHLPRLKQTGTYLILFRSETASSTWNVAIEKAKLLVTNGVTQSIATTVPGQEKRLVFLAGQGANLGLGVVDDNLASQQWSQATLTTYDQNGNQLNYTYCQESGGGCGINYSALPAGSYDLILAPATTGARTMQFGTVLSSDLYVALTLDTASPIAITRRGQNSRRTFAGTAGTTVGVQVYGQATTPAGGTVYYKVLKPDGTLLTSMAAQSGGLMNLSLPVTGNYQVMVDPARGETLSAQIKLTSGTAGGMVPDGASGSFATTVPGDGVYLTFLATAGQNMGFGVSELVLSSGQYAVVTAYAPDGEVISSGYCYASQGGCDVNLPNLVAGRYALTITPADSTQTMTFKTTLSLDKTANIVKDSPYAVNIARRGQNGRYTFTGAANQVIALQVSGLTTTPAGREVYLRLIKPDGTSLSSMRVASTGTLNAVLPVAGAYVVQVDPVAGATTAFTLTLASGTTTGTVLDAGSGDFSTTAGQSAFFTFTATAGLNAGLGISDLTVNASSYVNVRINRPDGSQHSLSACYVADQGCGVNLAGLAAGTWSVTIVPYNASQTMKFKATLSSDLAANLSRGPALSLNLDRRGQNARISFSGVAGESLALQTSAATTTPTGRSVKYSVYRPNGALLSDMTASTGAVMHLGNLPENGTYQVYVDPSLGSQAKLSLSLPTGTTGELELDGGSGTYNASAGQPIFIAFNAQAGQNLGFAISDLVLSTGSSLIIRAYRPDGNSILSDSCSTSENGCSFNIENAQAGRYSVYLIPYVGQSVSFKATLSSDLVKTLVRDVPMPVVIERNGQNARLQFSATAGESMALLAYNQRTTPVGEDVRYIVRKPNGDTWKTLTVTTGNALSLANLPSTGQYTVFAQPVDESRWSADIVLSTGVTSMQLDGASARYQTNLPGQPIHLSFVATTGQNLGFALSEIITANGNFSWFHLYAYKPDGSDQADISCYQTTGSCDFNITGAVAGRYSVIVVPTDGEQALQFKATLSSDKTATIARDVMTTFVPNRIGQNGRLSFTATVGETLALILPVTGSDVTYAVYKPDGSLWNSVTVDDYGNFVLFAPIPSTGTYAVRIDPKDGLLLSVKLKLSTGTPAVAVDGASKSFNTDLPGEYAHFTIDATNGQLLGVGISDLLNESGGGNINVYMYRPDGSSMTANWYCYLSNQGCNVGFATTAGRYSGLIGASQGTITGKVTASNDIQRQITPGVSFRTEINRRGQNARYTFPVAAGADLKITVSNQISAPVNEGVHYSIYYPSGSTLRNIDTFYDGVGPATITSPNLSMSGTYLLLVEPRAGILSEADLKVELLP